MYLTKSKKTTNFIVVIFFNVKILWKGIFIKDDKTLFFNLESFPCVLAVKSFLMCEYTQFTSLC